MIRMLCSLRLFGTFLGQLLNVIQLTLKVAVEAIELLLCAEDWTGRRFEAMLSNLATEFFNFVCQCLCHCERRQVITGESKQLFAHGLLVRVVELDEIGMFKTLMSSVPFKGVISKEFGGQVNSFIWGIRVQLAKRHPLLNVSFLANVLYELATLC